MYTSDTCAEADLNAALSSSFNCKKEGDKEEWNSIACKPDMTGYVDYTVAMYSTNDCSGDPTMSMVSPMKVGKCVPGSELDGNGTWELKSGKYTRSGEAFSGEEFSTIDCSGTASETSSYTCSACEEDDGNYMIITCPPENSAGPGDASGTFQPSCILSALILLAVGAERA